MVARFGDRFQNGFQGFFVRAQIGREATLITHRGAQATAFKYRLQAMENFSPGAQGFRERIKTDREHHELLHVDVVIGVSAAVDDVHHRHRQRHLAAIGQILPERLAFGGSGGMRGS